MSCIHDFDCCFLCLNSYNLTGFMWLKSLFLFFLLAYRHLDKKCIHSNWINFLFNYLLDDKLFYIFFFFVCMYVCVCSSYNRFHYRLRERRYWHLLIAASLMFCIESSQFMCELIFELIISFLSLSLSGLHLFLIISFYCFLSVNRIRGDRSDGLFLSPFSSFLTF